MGQGQCAQTSNKKNSKMSVIVSLVTLVSGCSLCLKLEKNTITAERFSSMNCLLTWKVNYRQSNKKIELSWGIENLIT